MAEDDSLELVRTWNAKRSRQSSSVSASEPKWRQEPEVERRKQRRAFRRLQFGIALVLFAAACAGLMWVSTWLVPPKSSFLLLVGAGYETNLDIPANLYGWHDLETIANRLKGMRYADWRMGGLRVEGPIRLQKGVAWDSSLDSVAEPNVLVYLSVHGGADTDGAYLLFDDADAVRDPRNRLRLTEVLDRMAKLPSAKRKVLVLDATQIESDWQLGLLNNTFARQLDSLDDRIRAIPNLVVICSSGIDQRSWVSDGLNATAFGHYFSDAVSLRSDYDGDGRVNLVELYQHVRGNVSTWAWVNRGSVQEPTLYPKGPAGIERAREIQIAVGSESPSKTVTVETHTGPFQMPAAVQASWQRCQAIAQGIPGPMVYAPNLWTRYRKLLLRHEELVLRGREEKAATLREQMLDLELQIDHRRTLTLASYASTLPMPALAGFSMPPREDLTNAWNRLWNAPGADAPKVWDQIQSQFAGTDLQLVRVGLLDRLLERVAASPKDNLVKGSAIVELISNTVTPLPAEIHFLIMVNRDLDASKLTAPQAVLVGQALRLRELAEQAALATDHAEPAFSERIWANVRTLVEQGDQARRQAEDLVFASRREDWEIARGQITLATKLYEQALANGEQVREAYGVLRQSQGEVPYLARWWGGQHLKRGASNASASDGVETVEKLLVSIHALAEILSGVSADAIKPLPEDLPATVDEVRRGTAELERLYREAWSEQGDVDTPGTWREIVLALSVPLPDASLRARILERRYRLAYRVERTEWSAPIANMPIAPAELENRAKRQAQREGRMALGCLGQWWFDRCGRGELETFGQVQRRLANFTVDERWWITLAQASEQLAQRWWRLPQTVNSDMQVYASKPSPASEQALSEGFRLLYISMDGIGGPLDQAPAERDRRFWANQFLVWQADRTFEDHWFAVFPSALPYYRVAGGSYLGDAESLSDTPARRDAVREGRARLDQSDDLKLVSPAKLLITSEQRLQAEFAIHSGAACPPGTCTLWVVPGENLDLQYPSALARVTRPVGSTSPPEPITCTIASPLVKEDSAAPVPTITSTNLMLHGLYRGQRFQTSTLVDIAPTPQVVVRQYPPPLRASVAVEADPDLYPGQGTAAGALAIVLDCSGSMGPLGTEYTPETKFIQATNALREVLQRVPRGTLLSLWVFGQAVGPAKTVVDPENTVRRVQDPVVWNPEDPELIDQLMKKIEYPALEPWNESPIVRAMLYARQDLITAPGFKTLVVVTDGMDNRFAHDPVFNANNKGIPAALVENFATSGIEVNMVGFKVVNTEEAKAREQFAVLEKLPLPGKWYTVQEAEQLADVLGQALRPTLRFLVEGEDGKLAAPIGSTGLEISRVGANRHWFPGGLAPGGYRIRLPNLDQPNANLLFEGGDLLLVRLTGKGGGLSFERRTYSTDDFPWKPSATEGPWRLALLQNQAMPDQSVRLLATLDRAPSSTDNTMRLVRPRALWFELGNKEQVPVPGTLSWNDQFGYPAAAWSIGSSRWPLLPNSVNSAIPLLRCWWLADVGAVPAAALTRGPDFASIRQLVQRSLRVEGSQVVVLDADIEDHVVETGPGVREKRSCLVIRLSHPSNEPVWIEPRGLAYAGYEHRFHADVQRYTGLFWPVTLDQADQMSALHFVSLSVLKRQAVARGQFLELDAQSAPQPQDVRPDVPIDLGGR